MPVVPPELARPYGSPADRQADWQRLLQRAELLRHLTALSDTPEGQWPAWAIDRVRAAPRIINEAPSERLKRWRSVFASELADLERAVLAASSQGGSTVVTDIDLRSAIYLAGRLLASLYGTSIGEVQP